MSNGELSSRWVQHGVRFRDQKQWTEALESFEKAIAFDTRNAQAWSLKGRALDEMNNLSDAIRCYKTSLDLNANSVRDVCQCVMCVCPAGAPTKKIIRDHMRHSFLSFSLFLSSTCVR